MDPIAAASLVVSVAGTALSTSISIAAWRAAHRSATADQMTSRIEAARRHDELTPQFTVTATTTDLNRAELSIELTGPVTLGRLQEVRVSIRNFWPANQMQISPERITLEDIPKQILGPYQFSSQPWAVDARTTRPIPLTVGDRRRLSLIETPAPAWITEERWWRAYDGEPVRLELHCRRDDHTAPWVVPVQVPVTSSPPA